MAGIKDIFANNPIYNVFGLVSGTSVGVVGQFPSGSCKLLRFKADIDNVGEFLIGVQGKVIWPMNAGDDTGWIASPSDHAGLAHFWFSGLSGTSERLYYWMQR